MSVNRSTSSIVVDKVYVGDKPLDVDGVGLVKSSEGSGLLVEVGCVVVVEKYKHY
jgi:hypothetical protein